MSPEYKELLTKLKKWDKAYARNEPLVSDAKYDRVKERFAAKHANHSYLKQVNSRYAIGEKVKLPHPMGSLTKLRPKDAYAWCQEHYDNILITPKLDGIAVKLVYDNHRLIAAYTRGNGTIGRFVLHALQHVNGVPTRIPIKDHIEIDGECIVHRTIFRKKYKNKKIGKKIYKAPRNFVGGMINTKQPIASMCRDLTFIVYDTTSKRKYENKYNQLLDCGKWGLITVLNPTRWQEETYDLVHSNKKYSYDKMMNTGYIILGKIYRDPRDVNSNVMRHYAARWQKDIDIDQDGLVLEMTNTALRKKRGRSGISPNYSVSIKPEVEDQRALHGVVKRVSLRLTSRGLIKPTGILKTPLDFNGVSVTRFTMHNMKTVKKHAVGRGAVVKLIRSGEVIPRFMKTIKPSEQVIIPKRCMHCDSKLVWTNSKTDLACKNVSCEGFLTERVVSFFSKFKIDNLSTGTVTKLMKAGYNTVPKIMNISVQKLARIDGMGEKSANKIINNMTKKLSSVSLPNLMHASCIFADETAALGKERAKLIVDVIKKQGVLDRPIDKDMALQLTEIKGIGYILAELVADNLAAFREFYKNLPELNLERGVKAKRGKLSGKRFAFTRYRDAVQEKYIVENGGEVASSIAKTVHVLFAGDMSSNKIQKARQYGIKIVDKENAMKYLTKL